MLKYLTDKELWIAIKNNDQNALTELFERHYFNLVKAGIHYSKDAEAARDIANDLFFNLWNKRKSLSEVEQVKSYLSVSYRNEMHRYLIQQQKQRGKLDDFRSESSTHEKSFEELLISLQANTEIREKLKRAFEKLTPRQKQYLQMKYFDGLTYEQIAEQSGQTIKTVYNTTYEALKVLRSEIKL